MNAHNIYLTGLCVCDPLKRGSLRFSCRFVERRVERVEVAAVQSVLQYAQTFAESLVMNKLSFAQEFDRVAHVGIVREAENVIVGQTRFLLCRESSVRSAIVSPVDAKVVAENGAPLAATG